MITMTLTSELKKEIFECIAQTLKLIEKENKYSYDLRRHDYIAKLENHLNNLYEMIKDNKIILSNTEGF